MGGGAGKLRDAIDRREPALRDVRVKQHGDSLLDEGQQHRGVLREPAPQRIFGDGRISHPLLLINENSSVRDSCLGVTIWLSSRAFPTTTIAGFTSPPQ